MRTSFSVCAVLMLVAGSVALVGSPQKPYSPREKAFYADRALVDFVRPGLTVAINSASISSAGVISEILVDGYSGNKRATITRDDFRLSPRLAEPLALAIYRSCGVEMRRH